MRRTLISFLILTAVLVCACKKDELPAASVRFRNIMTDHYEFPYGLMIGDAVYAGSLGYQESTGYMETEPGLYSVLARRVDGEWIVISEGLLDLMPGVSYTILIFGTVAKFSFQLSED
jgi:hypothetical protein